MIKSYKELSNRYIKQNKKRTTLTLIGIILSLSLISTIGLFMKGSEKSSIEQTKQSVGASFHIMYNTYTDDMLTKVSNNPNIEHYGIISGGEQIKYNDIIFQNIYVDNGASEILKYSIKEGRMPNKSDEICIDEWAKPHIKSDLKIGDKITIDKKQYTIVGFLKTQGDSQHQKISNAIMFDKSPKNGQLMVEINSKADFDKTLESLKSLSYKDNIQQNDELNRLEKMGSNKTMVTIVAIIIFIVVSATIIVIYNSFQISVAERMKQFGLLRSIGATKKQIRFIVFREATILLMIAIPIGLLISIGTIYALQGILDFVLQDNTMLSIVSIDIKILAISTIITILAVYISSLLPAEYVGNISPLVAISSRVVVKKESVKKRKNVFLKKIFNFKALMAIKNIGRNPKRCRVMILSIVVSSTLFITFTTLVQEAINLRGTNFEYQNIDLEISGYSENGESKVDDNLINKIKNLDNVEKVYAKYPVIYGKSEISPSQKVKQAGDIYTKENYGGANKEFIDTNIKVYDKVALDVAKKYVISGEINIDEINSQNGVVLVSNGRTKDNYNQRYMGKLTNYKVNDEIILIDDSGKEYKLKVMAIIENNVFERETQYNSMDLITTDKVMKNLSNEELDIQSLGVSLKDSSLHLKTYEEINTILQDDTSYSVTNYVEANASEKSSIILIKVLVYGFIFVITLISSINIINTITMNITLRRKELSVLKSIGMSQKDLKKMIMYEGLFYGLVGGILGSVAGCGFTYIIYKVFSDIIGLAWKVPWMLCIITIFVSIVISFLSALIPMRKIEKDNVIEVIREG
ncbi:ABC transporter permease [Paraclostridium ghonii]|uniref:ABC transport system permease protein n=1 Tax=Paraclostridium ghonii TaxID=29358 RepID=A0ABU0MZL0_9FIRM|nr:FtsX-like permease family protein [Paeniclostridium ghonii]MDQ0556350.1 putative ABC transport system permease protein [Paeniclostridium ghonii]